jgi:CubicO group peptidase (beta-lactamase class C family)
MTIPQRSAAELGMDPARLAALSVMLEADIEAGRNDGSIILVARRGAVAWTECRGWADREAGRVLTLDDIAVTMSVGKQFTNVLILNRVERGDLRLHAPVAEVIEEFAGSDKQRITLAHLLTHTSGLAAQPPAADPSTLIDTRALTAWAARSALESAPGSRVNYSTVVAHSVLGQMLVRTDPRGRQLADIFREDLFEPLGMTHTSLGHREDLVAAMCPVVTRYSERGIFEPEALAGMSLMLAMPGAEIPAGGFLSRATDLLRFAEMLRRGGELDGHRLLSPAMLALATRNHTGTQPNSLFDYALARRNWEPWPAAVGLGFFVRGDAITPGPIGNLASPGTFGGWGTGSTALWVDPAAELSFCLLSTGLMEDSRHIERVARLHDLVLSAVVD